MRLYIDPNYSPPLVKLFMSLHHLEYPAGHEVVSGRWSDEYRPADTAVFLIDTNKRGLNTLTLDQYAEGYKVVAYKKPEGAEFDPYKCALTMLSQWQKILADIAAAQEERLLIAIGNGDRPYRKMA